MPQLAKQAIYDIHRSWEENAQEGPFFSGTIPTREKRPATTTLFGFPLSSPIGVAAGPLLNSRWTTLAADLGFDIVTYKTIRSSAHPGHPLPNVLFLDAPEPLAPYPQPTVGLRQQEPTSPSEIAITNSFGMPSRGERFLSYDIHRAKSGLHPNQILVVSVVGSPKEGVDYAEDFAAAARIAANGGADVIELNFSCPNVKSGEGSLYLDPLLVEEIGKRVVNEFHQIPVIMKVGTFPTRESLELTLKAAAGAGIQGVCGINSVMGRVVSSQDTPALGEGRLVSGICGAPILEASAAFVASAREIIERNNLSLSLLAVGGVTKPEDFTRLLNCGADAALTATAMMWDPYLAQNYHHSFSTEEPSLL